MAAAVLPLDVAICRWWATGPLPGGVVKVVALSEAFAHGYGVALLLAVVWVLDINHRRYVLRLGCSAYVSGLVTNLVKISVGRTRPNVSNLNAAVHETFVGWLPSWTLGDWSRLFDRSIQSFPSGHTATAVGLAIGLICLYPQGRWLFIALAFLAALQRLQAGAHFPSDVLAAAGIACLVAATLWNTAEIKAASGDSAAPLKN